MSPQGPQRLIRVFGNSDRCVFLTINCWERVQAFVDAFAEQSCAELARLAVVFKVELLAYTLMPDHVHLLLRVSPQRDVWEFMRLWKQKTGYVWKQSGKLHDLWQRGYHDRVLRLDEDIHDFALYIYRNPVRRKLVSRPEEYKFSGGSLFHLVHDDRPA